MRKFLKRTDSTVAMAVGALLLLLFLSVLLLLAFRSSRPRIVGQASQSVAASAPSRPASPPSGFVTRAEFDAEKEAHERKVNALLDIIELEVSRQDKAEADIKTTQDSQGLFFSLQEDIRMRLEMLSGGYRRVDGTNALGPDENSSTFNELPMRQP
jgi:hypothetical protein